MNIEKYRGAHIWRHFEILKNKTIFLLEIYVIYILKHEMQIFWEKLMWTMKWTITKCKSIIFIYRRNLFIEIHIMKWNISIRWQNYILLEKMANLFIYKTNIYDCKHTIRFECILCHIVDLLTNKYGMNNNNHYSTKTD